MHIGTCEKLPAQTLWPDSSTVFTNVVQDINTAEEAFSIWGREFTYDCTKEKRGTEKKWLERNFRHVERLAQKSRNRLDC